MAVRKTKAGLNLKRWFKEDMRKEKILFGLLKGSVKERL
jgi:hypothetical protein